MLGRLLGAFSRCETFCLHLLFVFQEVSPLCKILDLDGKTEAVIKRWIPRPMEAYVFPPPPFVFVCITACVDCCTGLFTHWAGQFASNSLWYFWQHSALSPLSSRHFHSWSLEFQHVFLSVEFGADIAVLGDPGADDVTRGVAVNDQKTHIFKLCALLPLTFLVYDCKT